MTLFLHLLASDLGRLRLPLILWAVVVASATLIEGIRPLVATAPALREATAIAGSVLWLTTLLIGFALVSLIVHAHPPVGTDAFWMTRPIPPGLLVLSKLALVAATLVIVPAVAEAALMAAHGVPAAITAGVIAQRVELQTVIAAILLAGAALTGSLRGLTLVLGVAALAVATTIAVTIAIMTARDVDETFAQEGYATGDDAAASLVFNVLFVAAAVLLTAVQYRTRLRSRSVLAGLTVLALAWLAASIWPVPFLAPNDASAPGSA